MKHFVGCLAAGLVLTGAGCDRRTNPSPAASTTPAAVPPPPSTAPPPTPSMAPSSAAADASSSQALVLNFDGDTVGGSAKGVEAVIGDWAVAEREGARGLMVDGSHWRNGTPSINLVDQAKRLYGERYAEFLDGVRAFAFFPLAVAEQEPPAGDVRLSIRFYPIAGQIDQGAGIAFGIQPDGTYFGVRANALENNILWFKVVRGKRTVIDTVRNTPTASRTWHALAVTLRGREMNVELDGSARFHKTLDTQPHGRVGLWSKADSQVLFDDLRIEPVQ